MALFERFWDCPACGTKGISALRKLKCPNCGYTKQPQDQEIRSNIEITDVDGITLARGGPHWVCSSCGTVNLNKYEECSSCGNPKEESDHRNKVRELGTAPPPTYQPPDEDEQFYGKRTDEEGGKSNASVLPPTDSTYSEPIFSKRPSWLNPITIRNGLIALVVVALTGLLAYLLFHTKEVQAQATSFSWSRDVIIEEYRTVHESGWSYPAGAYNVRSEERIHHYDPIYEERRVTVHHDQTCYRDLGNGAEESYNCSYDTTETERVQVGEKPVYETWYEYDIDRWVYDRTAHAQSNDREPYWPEYTLYLEGQQVIGAERVGRLSENYTVYFEAHDKDEQLQQYSYGTSEAEWGQYVVGQTYILQVNHFDQVMNNPLQDSIATPQQ